MKKKRLQIDQSTIILKSDESNKLNNESPDFPKLNYSQIISNILGENADSNKLRQFYSNESLARNQLKNVLEKMTSQNVTETNNGENKMIMDLYMHLRNSAEASKSSN